MRYDFENKRFYKQKLKHLDAKPASAIDRKKYSYKVVSAEDCKEHGVQSPSDLLKFAIAKFDGEHFVEAAGWFSNEKSAIKSLKSFLPKKAKNKTTKKNKKKEPVPEIPLVFGYNTVKG